MRDTEHLVNSSFASPSKLFPSFSPHMSLIINLSFIYNCYLRKSGVASKGLQIPFKMTVRMIFRLRGLSFGQIICKTYNKNFGPIGMDCWEKNEFDILACI
jgi:hypothetical protein